MIRITQEQEQSLLTKLTQTFADTWHSQGPGHLLENSLGIENFLSIRNRTLEPIQVTLQATTMTFSLPERSPYEGGALGISRSLVFNAPARDVTNDAIFPYATKLSDAVVEFCELTLPMTGMVEFKQNLYMLLCTGLRFNFPTELWISPTHGITAVSRINPDVVDPALFEGTENTFTFENGDQNRVLRWEVVDNSL